MGNLEEVVPEKIKHRVRIHKKDTTGCRDTGEPGTGYASLTLI